MTSAVARSPPLPSSTIHPSRPSLPLSTPSISYPRHLSYFTSGEVSSHNLQSDCWVSYFGCVYELTPLLNHHNGVLIQPIVKFAGTDISHWFDAKTKEPKTHIDPDTGLRVPYCPHGRYLHLPPSVPDSSYSTSFGPPWWSSPSPYLIGCVSSAPARSIRIVNTLSGQEDLLEICEEERLFEIRERYKKYNQHANSYTWKRLGKILDMELTLTANGIPDEREEMEKLGMQEEEWIPVIHVYFNDDLSVE